MGVIIRQGIKQSIVNYSLAFVGLLSVLFVYPLDKEAYGLARFLIDTAMLCTPLVLLGANLVSVKYFPVFQADDRKANGLLGIILLIATFGSALVLIGAFFSRYWINDWLISKSGDFERFGWYCLPILILGSFIQIFTSYSSNFQRIVWPSLFQQLIKITLPIGLLMVYFMKWDTQFLVTVILFTFVMNLILVAMYIKSLKGFDCKINWGFLKPKLRSEMLRFGMLSMLGSTGAMLALRLDSVLVPTLIDLKSNGIFGIAAVMVSFMMIPTTSLATIAAPIISKALNDNDQPKLKELYVKSSLNSLIPALLLAICIAGCVHEIFQIMPKGHEMIPAIPVLYFLIGARIFDVSTGFNSEILGYSKHYATNLILLLILAISNIILCNYFITKLGMGILGAGVATFISLVLYNLLKLFFIYKHFKMLPFESKSFYLIFYSSGVLLVLIFFPILNLPVFFLAVLKCITATLLYVPFIYFTNISPEVTGVLNNLSGFLRNISPFK